MEFLTSLTTEWDLSPQSKAIAERYVSGLFEGDKPLRLDKFYGALDNLEKAIAEGEASFLVQKRGYKFGPVVDVIEFAESKQYMGQKGHLWPSTKDNLWQIFNSDPPAFEIVLGGAAGTGKSSTTWLAMGYIAYLVENLWSPQVEFGLMPDTTIFLVFQSVRLDTVSDALFIKLLRAIDNSPWFNEHASRQKDINSKIILPSNVEIRAFTGAVDSGLGKDIIAAAMTESNFMPVTKGSVKLQHSDKQNFNVAREMYTVLRNRIETRFSESTGNFPGKLITDSARNYQGDFTDVKKDERERDIKEKGYSNILIIERALWDAKPGYENEERFLVELGNDHRPARIIQSEDQAEDKEAIRRIPMRHYKAFVEDIEQALKDLGGVPSTKSGRFIPFPAEITAAQDKFVERTGGASLFLHESVCLNQLFEGGIDWSLLINLDYLKRMVMEGGIWSVHFDTSLSGDDTGFAIGRIIGSQVVERGHLFNVSEQKIQEIQDMECPIYMIDGALQIYARPGEQIPLNTCAQLVLKLKEYIPIRYGSADWLESAAMLQTWADNKIIAGHVSVDRSPQSCFEYKHAIQEGRILIPPHSVLDKETRRVQRITKGGTIKVDHPEGECLSGDTKISLLSGQEITIKELAEKHRGTDPIYVYTVKDGHISVGHATRPRKTRHNAETVIVALDNQQEVCCTPNHPFMLRDGSYRKASELKEGDSLMPLYRRCSEKGLRGYELLMDPDGSWHYTHKMVAHWKFFDLPIPSGYVVHHKDRSSNNDPRFLQIITRADHQRIHASLCTGASAPKAKRKKSASIKRYWERVKNGDLGEDYRDERLAQIEKWVESGTPYCKAWWYRQEVSVDEIKTKAKRSTTLGQLSRRLRARIETILEELDKNRIPHYKLEEWLDREYFSKKVTRRYVLFHLSSPAQREKARVESIRTYTQSDRGRENSRKNMIELQQRPDFIADLRRRGALLGKTSGRINMTRYNKSEAHRQKASEIGKRTIWIAMSRTKRVRVTIEEIADVAMSSYTKAEVLEALKLNPYTFLSILKRSCTTYKQFASWLMVPSIREKKAMNWNHKVISVRPGPKQDVYDLTVSGTENFALSAGVFVHNSKDVFDGVCGVVGVLQRTEAVYRQADTFKREKEDESSDSSSRDGYRPGRPMRVRMMRTR